MEGDQTSLTNSSKSNSLGDSLRPGRAVAYIRVSTRGQAERDGHKEGFSIPAQRSAIRHKAEDLGALVVKEFVERGQTGTTTDRPELRRMLAYVKDNPVDYAIVHKLDRLARSRAGDIDINRALEATKVRLVSTTENIDDSPSGMLLHGIMSAIAEFYSRNLAAEVLKGMQQKAQYGGTPGRAPIGYLNRRTIDNRRHEVRDVILDTQRAPLVQEAFQLYATGEWTLVELAQHLTQSGLCSRQTARQASRPITRSSLQVILTNPYYRGFVRFQGQHHYPGAHLALVPSDLWERVQTVLRSHGNGERTRSHPHYLKSSIFCGQCGRRLVVHHARSKSGRIYFYFVCRTPSSQCPQPACLIEEVDRAIVAKYPEVRVLLPQVGRSKLPSRSFSGHYRNAPPAARRLLNQALFDKILVDHVTV